MTAGKPFHINVSDDVIGNIFDKIRQFPWNDMPALDGWGYGTNTDYLKSLCDYWVNDFDWRAAEARINRFAQFTAPVDGVDMHFIHEAGSGPRPRPLLISHGWPGSIVEFLDII